MRSKLLLCFLFNIQHNYHMAFNLMDLNNISQVFHLKGDCVICNSDIRAYDVLVSPISENGAINLYIVIQV